MVQDKNIAASAEYKRGQAAEGFSNSLSSLSY